MMVVKKLARLQEIDMLRGLAMAVMVLLHTNAYFLSNPITFYSWDFGQFAVPLFIFCSSFVYYKKNYYFSGWKDFISYLKKRLIRLLVPYYLFASVFLVFTSIKEPGKITVNYLVQNLFITEGIAINWLVLLFIFFSVLIPFIAYIWKNNKLIFYIYLALSFISSVILMLYRFPYNYRIIMWLPYSLLIIFSLFVAKNENKKHFIMSAGIAWFIIFIFLRLTQTYLGHSLIMFNNKYPPNIYHLSYGIFSIALLFLLAKKGFFSFPVVRQLFEFLSKHSYSLYFIHYLIIYVLTVFMKIKFNWVSFFVSVLLFSLASQGVINILKSVFIKLLAKKND